MDLRDIFRDGSGLSPRYVLTLIAGLPADSAYVAERRGGQQFRGWTADTYAAVASANALRALCHMYLLTHIGKKAAKPKAPEPFPVPVAKTDTTKKPKAGSFAAMAGSMIASSRRKKAGK